MTSSTCPGCPTTLKFQPFLRFYPGQVDCRIRGRFYTGFQPFLRFYAAEPLHLLAVTGSEFQPFLRFYGLEMQEYKERVIMLLFQPFLRFYLFGGH